MMHGVSLRELQLPSQNPVLAAEVADLILLGLANQPEPDPIDHLRVLRDMATRTTVIAQDTDGQLLAAGAYRRTEGDVGLIEDVVTTSSKRKQGLGQRVIAVIEASARNQGINRLSVYPTAPSENFYQELGYTEELNWTKHV
jgi:GNAT superfamily N-acetyltransferase